MALQSQTKRKVHQKVGEWSRARLDYLKDASAYFSRSRGKVGQKKGAGEGREWLHNQESAKKNAKVKVEYTQNTTILS